LREEEYLSKIQSLEKQVSELKREIKKSTVYKHFFHYSRDLVCIANDEGRFLELSPSFSETLGYSTEELLDRPFTDFIHPDDLEATIEEIQLNQTGASTLRFENRYLKKNGDIIYLQWVSTADTKNKKTYAVARDVTEIRKTEEQLKRSQQLLSASQSMAKMGSWSFNLLNGDLYWSDELFNIFEIQENEKSNLYQSYLNRFDEEGLILYEHSVEKAIQKGEAYTFKHAVNIPNSETKYVYCVGIPSLDEKGSVVRIDGMVQDITEQTLNEKIIRKSIREKEILIQELHHRVKNNLQVINSLLSLQANLSDDERLSAIFRDSQERIRSMATIHDLLYHNEDVSMIDFSLYIQKLAQELLKSRKGDDHNIIMNINIPSIHYGIDTAVPLGLIFTEIMTNALKHAFDQLDPGTINISLERVNDKQCCLSFADNGKGFDPQKVDRTSSLGMLIMENLTEQLEGDLQIQSSEKGTAYKLTFTH
jgi:PAS domain S-box-containing protein